MEGWFCTILRKVQWRQVFAFTTTWYLQMQKGFLKSDIIFNLGITLTDNMSQKNASCKKKIIAGLFLKDLYHVVIIFEDTIHDKVFYGIYLRMFSYFVIWNKLFYYKLLWSTIFLETHHSTCPSSLFTWSSTMWRFFFKFYTQMN